jgi:hypothetical protein
VRCGTTRKRAGSNFGQGRKQKASAPFFEYLKQDVA